MTFCVEANRDRYRANKFVILLLFHRSHGHSETPTGKDHGIHYASTIGLYSINVFLMILYGGGVYF